MKQIIPAIFANIKRISCQNKKNTEVTEKYGYFKEPVAEKRQPVQSTASVFAMPSCFSGITHRN